MSHSLGLKYYRQKRETKEPNGTVYLPLKYALTYENNIMLKSFDWQI